MSNNSAAPTAARLRLLGNQSARVFLERDGGAHQCELIKRNPGCLVIAGNTGNVVCNTSFTDLSDGRVKTEIAEADMAELLQFDSMAALSSEFARQGPECGSLPRELLAEACAAGAGLGSLLDCAKLSSRWRPPCRPL